MLDSAYYYLGNNFTLVETDSKWVEIFYTYQPKNICFDGRNSVLVVPHTVIAYNTNDSCIIAKSYDEQENQYFYWLINKNYKFTSQYNKEVLQQRIGPLDSLSFNKLMNARNINLEFREASSLR